MGIGAAVAAALFAVAIYSNYSHQVAGLYADVARDHQREVVEREQRPWITDPSEVQLLAEGEALPDSILTALVPAGYRSNRARMCRFRKQSYLHLVYANGSQEVSMFVGPGRDGAASVHTVDFDSDLAGEHLAALESRRFTTILVTGPSGDAMSLARLVAGIVSP